MGFDLDHAENVAFPSAYLLVEELFPQVAGPTRDRLVRRVTEFLMTTLMAFCELHPSNAFPEPSRN
jgi:hypothetical protein